MPVTGVAVLIKQLMPADQSDRGGGGRFCLPEGGAGRRPSVGDLPRVGLFAEGVAVRHRVETFVYARSIWTISSPSITRAICAAMKDLFEDVRAVAGAFPARWRLAGLKKYIAQHNIRGERLAHILSGASVNFHGLRYVSGAANQGTARSAAGGDDPEEGSFLVASYWGPLSDRFNYRLPMPKTPVFLSGTAESWLEEQKRSSGY